MKIIGKNGVYIEENNSLVLHDPGPGMLYIILLYIYVNILLIYI